MELANVSVKFCEWDAELLPENEEGRGLVRVHHVEIESCGEEGDRRIGVGSFCLILGGAAHDEGLDIVGLCNEISDEICDAASAAFVKHRKQLERDGVCVGSANVMLVLSLYIEEEFRSRGVGSRVILEILRQAGFGCELAMLRPVPLERDGSGEIVPVKSRERRQRLVSLYKSLGFKPLAGSKWMVRDMSLVLQKAG